MIYAAARRLIPLEVFFFSISLILLQESRFILKSDEGRLLSMQNALKLNEESISQICLIIRLLKKPCWLLNRLRYVTASVTRITILHLSLAFKEIHPPSDLKAYHKAGYDVIVHTGTKCWSITSPALKQTTLEVHTQSSHSQHLSAYSVSFPAHFIELILSTPPTLLCTCKKNALGTHEEAMFVWTQTIHHGFINIRDVIPPFASTLSSWWPCSDNYK